MDNGNFYSVNAEPVRTVHGFSECVGRLEADYPDHAVRLRGQPNASHGLLPSIARTWSFGGKTCDGFTLDQERNLLHRFRRHTYTQAGRILSKWECLFLARHHGLPVRLLDWTASPLVALYWACEKDFEIEGAVYAFVRGPNENEYFDVLDTDVDPEDVPGVRVIYPFYPSARMTAQAGLFTILQHPWRDLTQVRPEEFKDVPFELDRIVKWSIPSCSKPAIMQELEKFGVNSRTLLPELDGLAQGLWRTAVLRAGS